MSVLKDFLIISRANIQLGTFPHAILGILLAAHNVTALENWSILLYIFLYFTLITYACNINCLYDRDADALYKKQMSDAVNSLGIKKIKIILVIELLIIGILLYYLYNARYFTTVTFAIIGLILATTYSMPPLRLKARGVISPLPVIIGLYTLPILGGWFLLDTTVSLYLVIFIIGYAFMNEGFTLVNTCEDYQEDIKTGVTTWAHILGLKRTLLIAFLFSFTGYACILALILKIFSLPSSSIIKLTTVFLLLLISCVLIGRSILDVWISSRANDLETSAKIYGKKMAKWFMMTRYPLMIATLILLL